MKVMIVYYSLYGNTGRIARAIGRGMGEDVKVLSVDEADPEELGSYDIVVIGSPTQGGRHTKQMQEFLHKIPAGALKNKSVAAFDTRVKAKWVKIFGYAALRIADILRKRGADLIVPPEPFYVESSRGPLFNGEVARANAWGKTVIAGRQE